MIPPKSPPSQLVKSVTTGVASIDAAALEYYRYLLRLGDAATAEQRTALRLAAHALGKSDDDLAADHDVIRQAQALQALTAKLPELESMAKTQAAQAQRVEDDNAKIIGERQRLLQAAQGQANHAQQQWIEAQNADLDYQKLKLANPDLLGE